MEDCSGLWDPSRCRRAGELVGVWENRTLDITPAVRCRPKLPGRRGQLLGEDAHLAPGRKTLSQHRWKMGYATVTEFGSWPAATTDIGSGAMPAVGDTWAILLGKMMARISACAWASHLNQIPPACEHLGPGPGSLLLPAVEMTQPSRQGSSEESSVCTLRT